MQARPGGASTQAIGGPRSRPAAPVRRAGGAPAGGGDDGRLPAGRRPGARGGGGGGPHPPPAGCQAGGPSPGRGCRRGPGEAPLRNILRRASPLQALPARRRPPKPYHRRRLACSEEAVLREDAPRTRPSRRRHERRAALRQGFSPSQVCHAAQRTGTDMQCYATLGFQSRSVISTMRRICVFPVTRSCRPNLSIASHSDTDVFETYLQKTTL